MPAKKLDKTLQVQTHVNGELRQNATTEDLIFSIPYLIMTLSEGQTLMPGDVLATGTVSEHLAVLSSSASLIYNSLLAWGLVASLQSI